MAVESGCGRMQGRRKSAIGIKVVQSAQHGSKRRLHLHDILAPLRISRDAEGRLELQDGGERQDGVAMLMLPAFSRGRSCDSRSWQKTISCGARVDPAKPNRPEPQGLGEGARRWIVAAGSR